MGDSGSYFLGYAVATVALGGPTRSQKASTAVALLVPCLALGVPIFDTLFSMVRRFLERRSMFSPDRGHLHHRLIDMGLTHRRAVLTLYGVSVVLCVSAIAVTFGRGWQVGLAVIVASSVLMALVRFAGYFEYLRVHLRRRGRMRSGEAQALRRVVPNAIVQLAACKSEADVWNNVDALTVKLENLHAVVRITRLSDGKSIYHSPTPSNESKDLVVINTPLGDEATAVSQIVVALDIDNGLDIEVELLVQLLVDAIDDALAHVKSPSARSSSRVTGTTHVCEAIAPTDQVEPSSSA